MNQHKRAAVAFLVMGVVYVLIGIPLSVAFGRGFGAPLFWLASGSLAAAWFLERKASSLR
ncbi:hypothetical protein ACOT81_27485 [Streptomyces sp. WI04-05B]|jgi:hypothetical protein|uniref:hypothetical protein n=1 Tax=Streptomyces TaxID=1883 RepID=UPI000D1B5AD0|nr:MULTISPECIES: hypothetical protein [unclassified Streptomyces]AVV46138.1 hypothetical protein C6376_37015 [Streptomyces sp. P3]MDX2546173.1 hypothetical protein [Streptomyces sp. WI04-05B]MDX2587137.1 hypothetical protein [Streptomyces sp. WI04-05A]MDX3750674.1 hypothetical protein [Streptomyces sp. AK08-02]